MNKLPLFLYFDERQILIENKNIFMKKKRKCHNEKELDTTTKFMSIQIGSFMHEGSIIQSKV